MPRPLLVCGCATPSMWAEWGGGCGHTLAKGRRSGSFAVGSAVVLVWRLCVGGRNCGLPLTRSCRPNTRRSDPGHLCMFCCGVGVVVVRRWEELWPSPPAQLPPGIIRTWSSGSLPNETLEPDFFLIYQEALRIQGTFVNDPFLKHERKHEKCPR